MGRGRRNGRALLEEENEREWREKVGRKRRVDASEVCLRPGGRKRRGAEGEQACKKFYDGGE